MNPIDEKKYPWVKAIRPMIRQIIREEMGHANSKIEVIKEVARQEIYNEAPARHGQMWGRQEREKLIDEINWTTIKFIAAKHQRTLGSIICQLKREWEEGNL